MPALTEKQLRLASLLATGMTQLEAAAAVNISRQSVSRYLQREDFRAEVERRKQEAIALQEQAAKQAAVTTAAEFQNQLTEYTTVLASTYKARLRIGQQLQEKMERRLNDLPDEAFGPKEIASLLIVSSQMIDRSLQGWAELLALDELMERILKQD